MGRRGLTSTGLRHPASMPVRPSGSPSHYTRHCCLAGNLVALGSTRRPPRSGSTKARPRRAAVRPRAAVLAGLRRLSYLRAGAVAVKRQHDRLAVQHRLQVDGAPPERMDVSQRPLRVVHVEVLTLVTVAQKWLLIAIVVAVLD